MVGAMVAMAVSNRTAAPAVLANEPERLPALDPSSLDMSCVPALRWDSIVCASAGHADRSVLLLRHSAAMNAESLADSICLIGIAQRSFSSRITLAPLAGSSLMLVVKDIRLYPGVADTPSAQRPAFRRERLQGHEYGPPSRISVMFPSEQEAGQ